MRNAAHALGQKKQPHTQSLFFLYIFSSATAAFSLWRPASMIELSAAA